VEVTSPSHRHRSIHAASAALALACLVACGTDTVVTQRRVVANVPAACAVGMQGFATYYPLGDFEPPPSPASLALSATGTPLTQLDADTRELVLSAQQGVSTWEGLGPVGATGDVNVLVLPQFQPCALTQGVGMRTGSSLGALGSGRALLAGGAVGRAGSPDYVVHLDTGALVQASPEISIPRTQATVTAFGGGGLVAGGLRADNLTPLSQAEVLEPDTDGFSTQVITLEEPRRGHAAVVLADGDTLLVGGYADMTDDNPLTTFEVVYAASGAVSETDVGPLNPVLTSPVAVRLASGEVLVAGNTQVEQDQATGLEWFDAEGHAENVMMQGIKAGASFALIALEGGGALAVVAPPTGAAPGFPTTWVVGADHSVTLLPTSLGSLTAPILFGGEGGAPLLWTGDRWLRWQAWPGGFGLAAGLEGVTSAIGDASATLDPGLAMWLDPMQQRLVALRIATTNAYSDDPAPFVTTDGTCGAPNACVAPDRLPGASGVTFTGGTGLTLVHGASAFVTDRTYADASIHVAFAAGHSPSLVLRDDEAVEHVIDDGCCAGLLTATGPAPVMDVERHGGTLTCAVDGAAASTCGVTLGAETRVSVGVRGALPSTPSIVQKIIVTRLGAP
jgi:hypothetical protein